MVACCCGGLSKVGRYCYNTGALFGFSLAIAKQGWYGVGTCMDYILAYASKWTARIAPSDARLVVLLYRAGLYMSL